jgi:hypothetical protein
MQEIACSGRHFAPAVPLSISQHFAKLAFSPPVTIPDGSLGAHQQ